MTSTAVVLGIAVLGTPEAAPDCDCAADAPGIAAIRKSKMNFMVFSSRSSFGKLRSVKEY
jgi:hypothetical protein